MWHAKAAAAERSLTRPCRAVGAHYFTWYREGYGNAHWNDTASHGAVSDLPRIGYYDFNRRLHTTAYHLQLMADAKIDFARFNLHVNDFWPRPVRAARRFADGRDCAVHAVAPAVLGQPLSSIPAKQPAIEQALSTIRQAFLQSDETLNFDDRLVLSSSGRGLLIRTNYFIHKLQPLSQGVVRHRAQNPQLQCADGGAGFHPSTDFAFSPLELVRPKSREMLWQRNDDAGAAMRAYCRSSPSLPAMTTLAAAHLVRHRNPFREVPRHDGATYRRTIDFALRQKVLPDITLVATFNEFHENTKIPAAVAPAMPTCVSRQIT